MTIEKKKVEKVLQNDNQWIFKIFAAHTQSVSVAMYLLVSSQKLGRVLSFSEFDYTTQISAARMFLEKLVTVFFWLMVNKERKFPFDAFAVFVSR